MLKTMTVRATIAAILAGLCMSAHAIADTQRIDIPAGSLLTALETLAQQANVDLVYQDAQVEGLQTGGVTGELSPHDAVVKLLQGTPLEVRSDEASGAILITTPASAPTASLSPKGRGTDGEGSTSTGEEKKSFWSRVHLAQSETPSPSQGEGRGEDGAQKAEAQKVETPAQSQKRTELEEIVVTGSHIRGVTDTPAPRLTIDREDFQRSGATTLEEVFETLPQNFDRLSSDGIFSEEGNSFLASSNLGERASAIDLRGLGAESTLTLVNGNRRAGSIQGRVVDISTIPLAAIESIDVVTGGASAIYGADAVAGVVNIVTRRAFNGAETEISYGGATEHGGGERLEASQIFGRDLGNRGFVFAYDYAKDWQLNLADIGQMSFEENAGLGITYLGFQAQPGSVRHSGFAAGRVDLSDRIELSGDLMVTDREFEIDERYIYSAFGAAQPSTNEAETSSTHVSGSVGLGVEVGEEWSIDLSGAYGSSRSRNTSVGFNDLGFFTYDSRSAESTEARLSSLSAIAQGTAFNLGSTIARTALGLELRREEIEYDLHYEDTLGSLGDNPFAEDRTVRSAFAELRLPWVVNGSRPGLHRLEASIAVRYDDYSDVGDSTNAMAGLVWAPGSSVSMRGNYSTAFRAPALFDFKGTGVLTIVDVDDPALGGAMTPVLFLSGTHSALQPEEAESWSVALDYTPERLPWGRASLTYFAVDYDQRLETPATFVERPLVLEREDRYTSVIERTPATADVDAFIAANTSGVVLNQTVTPWDPVNQSLLEAFSTLVLFDQRLTNIASEKYRGLDLNLASNFDTAVGALSAGLSFTYTLEHERKVTPTSGAVSRINEVGKPVDLRLRANLGWTRGAYGAFLYLNYVDDYANPFSVPASSIGSWTTVDLTLRFDGNELASAEWLRGVTGALTIDNALDKEPPFFGNSQYGIRYDTTNASPVGRYISLRLTKSWQ